MNASVVSQSRLILEEHRQLRHSLNRIESLLANPPHLAHRARWLVTLAEHLKELKPRLEAHFAAEEKGGLFEEIQEGWPGTADLCRHLLDEHRTLLRHLTEIIGTAASAPTEEPGFHLLTVRACGLVKDLAHHEQRENDLLFRTLEGGPAAQD